MRKPEPSMDKAIEALGGLTAIAKLMDPTGAKIKQQHVWYWLRGANKVPAERALQIHEATEGRLSRTVMRPDLYPPEGEAS